MPLKCPRCHSDNPDTQKFCGECAAPLTAAEDIQPSLTKTLLTPVEDLAKGTIFAGRYKVLEELGKGGMGRVYKALDSEIHEEVALKLLKPEIAADDEILERFRNELKIARKISHKNVCRMYHISKEEGTPYITMEYVLGEDLKSLIKKKEVLEKGEALAIAKQVCDGLIEAHKLGVVHRDLKPQNIMIDESGNAKIMDFGIARSVEAGGMTQTGMIIGTPDYISPEQAEGREADHRSDIYSLGVILYEMMTGNVPFKGDTALSVALKHKSQLPMDPKKINPGMSDDLARLILICMEKDRERRYQTAEALLDDLRNIEEGFPLGTKTRPRRETFVSTLTRKKLFVPATAAVGLAIIAIAAWRLFPRKEVISSVKPDRPSIAIMDFKNNTGDQNLDHLSEGIASQLTYDLMQSKYLYVLPYDRLLQILNRLDLHDKGDYSTDVLAKVADRGVVEYIIQGAYDKSGDDFRISFRIQKAGSWEIIGSEMLPGQIERRMSMVDELTLKIKSHFNLSAEDIAADIDFDIGEVTTESTEALTYFNEGMKYFGKSDWTPTIKSLEKAVEIDPQFAMAHSFLAWTYYIGEYFARVSEHLEKALSASGRLTNRERNFTEALYYGLLERKYDKAEESLKKILEIYPEDWLANYMLGRVYLIVEEWEKACELLLENKRNKVDFAENYRELAVAYEAKGLYDEAIEVCEYATNSFFDTAYMRYELSEAYLCKGQLDMALEAVNKAKALFPPPAPYNGALIWQRGNILMCMEDWAEAEKEFRVLISGPGRREGFQFGLHRLGHLFKTRGKLEKSIEMYKKGIEPAKNEKTYNFEMMANENLAYTYLESGNLTEALKASEEHTRLAVKFLSQPGYETQFLKGYVCARAGAIKEAQNAADELKIMVDNGLSKKVIRYYYLLMGMIEFKADNYKEAERYQTQALLLLPFQAYSAGSVDHALFHNALATTYLKLGELDKAQEQYEIITSLTRGRLGFGIIYAKSYYMLGKIHEQRGDSAKAIEHYEKFLDLWKDADPGITEVDDARKRLTGLRGT